MKRLALLLLVAALSGCVVAPPVYRSQPYGAYPVAPYTGVVGVAPGPGYFWIDGGWLFEGGRRVWQPGRWQHGSHGHGWGQGHDQGWRR